MQETTTGIHRLRAMEAEGALKFPVIAVNDTPMKPSTMSMGPGKVYLLPSW